VDGTLSQHGVVLDLTLAQSRGVVGDDDHLGLAGAEGLDGGLVTEGGLTRLHDQLDLAVD